MRLAFIYLFLILIFACSEASKDQAQTADNSDSSATVNGTVEQEDAALFANEVDVNDWSTVQATQTTGTNLRWHALTSPKVDVFRLDQLDDGSFAFVLFKSLSLNDKNQFSLKVEANTYYVVKYGKLSAMIPTLAVKMILPLILDSRSSIAVNLFINMLNTDEGKKLAAEKTFNDKIINSVAEVVDRSGFATNGDGLPQIVEALKAPTIAAQKGELTEAPVDKGNISEAVEKITAAAIAENPNLSESTKSKFSEPLPEDFYQQEYAEPMYSDGGPDEEEFEPEPSVEPSPHSLY